ncbi:hypothetical protein ACQKCJ_16360 [Flavobacterium sp. NPDC079362]|uniref:hypothetical protein n=1 Tax=Flavobacterium sp. NPDC079362 TaxID=3390566 RepID=UPI003D04B8A9
MALQTLNTIKQWFKTGLKPTQTQFWDTWDSFRHKFDKIPVKEVEGLDELLLSKADKTALDSHIADKNAHAPQVNTDWNSESGFSQLLNKPEFKTINGEPLTGGGNIIIEAGGSQNLQTTLANGNETTNSIIFNDDYYNWLKTSIDSRSIRLTDSNSDMLVAIDSAGVVTRDDSQHVSLNPQGIFFNRDTADTAESYLRINESSTGVSTVNLPVTKGKEITLAATDDFKTINGESIVGEGNLDIEPRGLKSVLDADPTASYGQSKATVMGDYGNSKYNELIVSDETEKTGIYQLKNQLSFDHTVLDSNDIGNITLSEGNVILTRDKSNNQTVVDISDPVANTQLRFPAKSEEGKTYTIATTEDFKTINGESIVGSGDILISGGAGDIPTLQEVLDKDRNATNASINLLSEDEESQTTVHEGGLNISAKAETGFLITDINKLGVSVSKDEETTFVNVLADELSLNKNLSGNPVKQGIVLNEESSGASTIKLPLTSDGNVKTLATTEDFKTINGESIVGEGDIVISGTTLWKAGTVSTSITTVDGDNEASGTKSIAIGHQTAASGYASYAEGSFTQSSGNNSHAEGNETTSSSSASHSEGYQTSAQGPYSHAEGQATKAFGTGSHSEGYQTIAQGIYSHAEGKQTTALGDYSHAEGNLTIALGENSHAGGNESEANGLYSFVHGNNSFANNENTIVLGANITGIESDTTYVDKLNIKSVPAGTLDRSLGIDVDGNVIAGNVGGVGSQTFDQILDAGNTAIGKTMVLNYPNEATSTLNGFNISVDNQRGNSVTTSPNIISVESRNQNKRISILSDQIEFYNSLNESDKVRLASRGIEPNATGTIYLPTLKTGPNSRTLAATDDFKTINGQSILGEGNIYI